MPEANEALQASGPESASSDLDQSAAESAIGGAADDEEAADAPLQSSAMQEAPAAPASAIEQPTAAASPTASPLASPESLGNASVGPGVRVRELERERDALLVAHCGAWVCS